MKKLLALLSLMLLSIVNFAQAPEKINYQAVVRDASGMSVVSQLVGVKVSILQTSSLGTAVFTETHGTITNGYGLINLQIGTGTNTGPALSTIDWGADNYFVKIEIDPTGGTAYSVSSVSQLLSVPFALYAKTAENIDDADADPTNEYNTGAAMNADILEITDGGGTIDVDLSNLKLDPDMDATNEIQALSKVGQVVSLSNGGGAFTDDVDDADNDNTNELNQTISLVGTTLLITDAGGTLNADLSSLSGDADSDPTNEIQTVNKVGQLVTLSDGGGSFTDEVDDADADATNELQTISKAGQTVTLSDAGGSFIDDVNDADADATNELQTLSQAGSVVTLSNSGGTINIDDSDADATNEYNTGANLAGTDLNITDGGSTITVDLSSLVGGGDPSSTNELITGANLTGTDLNIIDAGGTTTVDLSALGGGADPSSSNELITGATLTGTDLNITDAGGTTSVDLSSLSVGGSSFRVGQYYQGGIIVWVDTAGTGGLIAGLTDLGTGIVFESPNTTPLIATDSTDGDINLVNIQAAAGTFPASDLCEAYSVGAYNDWFLPSVYELQMLSQSNYVMGPYALVLDQYYWSSTEVSTSGFGLSAYAVAGNNGFIQLYSQSTTSPSIAVRPMRRF